MKKITFLILLFIIASPAVYGHFATQKKPDYPDDYVNEMNYDPNDPKTYRCNQPPVGIEQYDSKSLQEIEDSYAAGWDAACNDVFLYHDELYYDGDQYSINDYFDNYNDNDASEYSYDTGYADAISEIFCDTDVLCWGEERYYRSDFE